ncbi:Imm32 family immunity protein [Dyella sp. 2RAB6]|uniref:Imm32 family immunity protein n=1 Tax=Dyella sp. 2RAB6 TaxID=3232992 RepID=UPI003F918C73
MKIYGYIDEEMSVEEKGPKVLAEVTLVASPEELRKMASFLLASAESMESMGASYNHEHLADKQPCFVDSPELIVFNPVHIHRAHGT